MELFGPTVQGEGLMTGTITHFLRTGGCGLRCSWCDSMFAVDSKQIRAKRSMLTTTQILNAIKGLPPVPYVTFTGGDPCLHKQLGELVIPLNVLGMKVAVETQGEMFPDWLETVDVITFSPKGPSSGNPVDTGDLYDWLERRSPKRPFQVCIKIVIFTEDDYRYAIRVYEELPEYFYDSFYFTAGTSLSPTVPKDAQEVKQKAFMRIENILNCQQSIAEALLVDVQVTKFNNKVHVGCQQHVLLWPHKDKGV